MQSRTAIINDAQSVLAQYSAATSGTCAVLWQKCGEADQATAQRVALARERLPDGRLLIVVCGPAAVPKRPGVCVVELPRIMLSLFDKPARYRVCYGGRGAGRSWSFARVLLVKALERCLRILCAREFQNSIADSIHVLLSDQIEVLGLAQYFEVQSTAIYARNGSEFVFSGIRTNPTRIKSMEGANIAFIEEAAQITQRSLEILIPTIRAAGSEIWCAFNPDLATDPTYERFVSHPPASAIVLKTTFSDNPWFPRALEAERLYLAGVDDDGYRHIYLGEPRQHSDAQVFKGKFIVESFEPGTGWDGPYYGADWGFAQDPTTLVKAWIHERVLYVEHEAYGVGVDIDRTPTLFDVVPGARHATIRADSGRPETISYMQRHGYTNIGSVAKWSGSVEDGIAHLRSYEQIKIHPRCLHTIEEMRLYSFKVDRLSGDIQPDPVDRHNHLIDALRYALTPMIKGNGPEAFLAFLASQAATDAQRQQQAAEALAKRPGVIVTDDLVAWHKE